MIWTHVSELAIDRLVAGEMPPADAAAMRDHATSCVRCGALLDDAVAVQRAFVPARLPIPMRRRAPIAIVGSLLAAATVLAIAWPRPRAAEIRTKGTAIVGFFVAHDDAVRRGTPREPVVPGDRIELYTTAMTPQWFAVVGHDAAGTRTIYVAPRAIEPGRERLLPLSIELDATLGDEVVTAMFCDGPFDPLAPPDDCTLDRFTLVKVPR